MLSVIKYFCLSTLCLFAVYIFLRLTTLAIAKSVSQEIYKLSTLIQYDKEKKNEDKKKIEKRKGKIKTEISV